MSEDVTRTGKIRIAVLWLVLVISFSCENPLLFNRCPDCIEYEPTGSIITIRFTPPSAHVKIKDIRIYNGNIDEGILLGKYDYVNEEWTFRANLNSRYTAAATYTFSGRQITVVDSTIPRVKREKVLCDQPCYMLYDNRLDLRIKLY